MQAAQEEQKKLAEPYVERICTAIRTARAGGLSKARIEYKLAQWLRNEDVDTDALNEYMSPLAGIELLLGEKYKIRVIPQADVSIIEISW